MLTPKKRIRWAMGSQVTVHTIHDRSLDGVLAAAYSDCVVLRHASFSLPEGQKVDLDGEQLIPLANIEWIQEWSHASSAS